MDDATFQALPSLRPDSHVKLIGIHCQANVTGAPYTIECPQGHFKVPRVLVPLCKRAFEALDEHYEGPDEGPLNIVLRAVADREGPKDDIDAMIDKVLDEALAGLKKRILEAAKKLDGRAILVAEAVKVLAGHEEAG